MIEPATKKDLAKLKTDLIRTLVTWQLINVAMVFGTPDQNIGKAGTIVSSPKPVPRAELVINTEIVRRGELVVHSGTAKL